MGFGDAVRTRYQVLHSPITSMLDIYANNSVQSSSTYTVDSSNGMVTFDTAPSSAAELTVDYKYGFFTDIEVDEFLDDESLTPTANFDENDGVYRAAARGVEEIIARFDDYIEKSTRFISVKKGYAMERLMYHRDDLYTKGRGAVVHKSIDIDIDPHLNKN